MTTPLIMLGLLIAPSIFNGLWKSLSEDALLGSRTEGCIGITLVFCFTGLGHFVQTESMAQMLPPWIPFPLLLVHVTGVIELLLAAMILVRQWRRLTGILLILILFLLLPVNIYAALNRIGMGGHEWGPIYLLIRVPLQLILIGWIWWFAVRRSPDAAKWPERSVTESSRPDRRHRASY